MRHAHVRAVAPVMRFYYFGQHGNGYFPRRFAAQVQPHGRMHPRVPERVKLFYELYPFLLPVEAARMDEEIANLLLMSVRNLRKFR